MHYNYIAIEGNIGSGKTSLSTMLAEEYNAKLILEQFQENPFLAKFYEDKERYAFQVEISFLTERYHQLKTELANRDIFQPQIISDYFINKCQIFANSNLQDDDRKLFNSLFTIINSSLPKPDLIVYLFLNSETLLNNISKRGRIFEQKIEKEYLETIHKNYFEYFKQLKDKRILIIDTTNIDFVKNTDDYQVIKNVIAEEYPLGTTRIIL
ncbi:MAG: deoxynucleoside kinase [Flavobacteriales bacterium]|nr:deoxynucleoside kinase [Flavobacteriales bacterium]